MFKILENLINNKYYAIKEEVKQKVNVFFAYNIITEDEYTKLMSLTAEMYKETTIEGTKSEENTENIAQ